MILTSEPPKTARQKRGNLPVLSVSTWSDFQAQSRPIEDAILWQRFLPKAVQDWLDQIPETRLPSARYRLKPVDVGFCLAKVFGDAGHPGDPALSWLSQDVGRLAHLVADINGVSSVRLRIEPVFDNACRRFHVDNVVCRLICTYRGPGTQLSLHPGKMDEIETISTGAPILLKGKQWPQGDSIGLHHRSPPIEGTGLSRLVLVLDPVHEDDEIGTSYDRRFIPN
ncbi:MAG: DUF1826 domain-containing protein [Pseudomonadota bacterium]